MFLAEARIVAPIQHRNVAQVFDFGEAGSRLYLVLEANRKSKPPAGRGLTVDS